MTGQKIFNITRSITRSNLFLCFVIAILWQMFYALIGFTLDNFFPHLIYATQSQEINTLQTVGISHHLNNWDSVWYLNIAERLYTWNEFSAAFYPLYPLLIKSISLLSFGLIDLILSALIVNTITLAFTLCAVINIGLHFFGKKRYIYVIIACLVLASPVAIFMHLIYTEALFCALAFWSYYFALKGKWLPMSLLLTLLTATRITSILVIGLCLLEYWRHHSWNIKRALLNRNILWLLLIPLGFLSYMILLKINVNDPLAMLHAYGSNSWSYHKFNPNIIETVWNETKETGRVLKHVNDKQILSGTYFDLFIVNTILPLIALAITFAASAYSILVIRRWGIPLGVYGLVSIIMFTLNSNLVSVHRYTLPVLTIYIALGHLATKSRLALFMILFSIPALASLQGILFLLFTRNVFIG